MTDRTRPAPEGGQAVSAQEREALVRLVWDDETTYAEAADLADKIIAAGWRPVPAAGRSEAEIKAEPVWAGISEDWKRPTLARVTFEYPDGKGQEVTEHWYRRATTLHSGSGTWSLESVTGVTVLRTHDPEMHVPVERALIAEAFDFIVEHGEGAPTDLERRLRAALADWAGRSATEAKAAALREASEALWGAVDAMRRARRVTGECDD